jgi:hypothetical protein
VEPCGLIVLNSLQSTCGSFRCGGPFRCGALDSEIECQARARLREERQYFLGTDQSR